MPKSPSLTKGQWVEIYYALDTKAHLIKDGFYGAGEKRGEKKRWLEAIKEIMGRISNEIDI